jgi:transcriptional regulator with XRE-family HTH domain
MLSATLQEGLSDYGIGEKIRGLRLNKKLGLVELGKHCGLSPALLSKIERGRLFPTLPTLLRIALVFGVGLEFFFAGAREKPLAAVVRKPQRVRLPDRPGAREVAFRFESLDFPATERRFNSYYAEFFPSRMRSCGRTCIRASSSSTRCRGRSPCTWGQTCTSSRRATRCTSIRACRTRIAAAARGCVVRSS